jgi:hypothetical protein
LGIPFANCAENPFLALDLPMEKNWIDHCFVALRTWHIEAIYRRPAWRRFMSPSPNPRGLELRETGKRLKKNYMKFFAVLLLSNANATVGG